MTHWNTENANWNWPANLATSKMSDKMGCYKYTHVGEIVDENDLLQ